MRDVPIEEILMYALLVCVVVMAVMMTVVTILALWPREEITRVPDAPVFASVTSTLSVSPETTDTEEENIWK